MRKLHFAYLLAFAPMLMGADVASYNAALIVNSLPICEDNQYLTYASGGLSCREVTGAMLTVPDCNKTGQLLTYTKTGEIGVFTCTDKGTESLNSSDVTLINNTYNKLVTLNTTLTEVEMAGGMKASAAKYCGQYVAPAGQMNQNGQITGNGVTGIAGAAFLCSQVATCGTGARMCTVYDMYNSVVHGAITQAATVTEAWVHMSAWAHNRTSGANPGQGLNENCGDWTYPTGHNEWFGTTVQWKDNGNSATRSLHFKSGPNAGVTCGSRFPIACCK